MHESTDQTKHIESVVFLTLAAICIFASNSGVSSQDEPWSGRYWEMTQKNYSSSTRQRVLADRSRIPRSTKMSRRTI